MANFSVTKAPDEKMSLTNMIFFSRENFTDALTFCAVKTESGSYIFKAAPAANVSPSKVAFGLMQRKWANLSLDQPIVVQTQRFNPAKDTIALLSLSITPHSKKVIPQDPLDSDMMAKNFSMDFSEIPLTVGQHLLFKFVDKLYVLEVQEIQNLSLEGTGNVSSKTGLVSCNSSIMFDASAESQIMLIGKAAKSSGNKMATTSIFAANWDFNQLGIGGLDKEFSAIFRRTFASRMFPPAISKQLGLKHVRGILLYGPPGTGKTLMARQIGKMLNAREPKIVNGPSILDKYVGESEANVRKLFADAEEENKRMGVHSALHIIVFDEIDAICKQRGSVAGGAGVHDTVVNQLLTKMDGVDQLNNILVIGMTNRRDMIDEALLRPGRFEMQMEISLPDEDGRLQILEIHTGKMHKAGKLSTDVDLRELAHKTKNFSGAEIEGLCRAAAFTAMYQLIKPGDAKQTLDPDAFDHLLVKRSDFVYALENDVKPMFGTAEEELSCYAPRGIINWGESVSHALDMGRLAVKAVSESDVETYRPLTLLLEGPSKAGKTALAVEIARQSGFPFVKICTSHKMTGFTETAKCQAMKKIFDDAAKSTLSVVIVDNIEGLIEYNPVGPRFSNFMVQAIKDLISQPLKAGRHMLVIGTTSVHEALSEQHLAQAFSWNVHVHMISNAKQLLNVLEEDDRLDAQERDQIARHLKEKRFCIGIKHLIDLLDLVTKTDRETRVSSFISRLEEDAMDSLSMNNSVGRR